MLEDEMQTLREVLIGLIPRKKVIRAVEALNQHERNCPLDFGGILTPAEVIQMLDTLGPLFDEMPRAHMLKRSRDSVIEHDLPESGQILAKSPQDTTIGDLLENICEWRRRNAG